jgi:hypothetical protein
MHTWRLATAALAFAVLAAPARAQTEWTFRVHGAWAEYGHERGSVTGLGRSRLVIADGPGFDLAAEVTLHRAVGLALGIGRTELDGELDSFVRTGPRPEDERPFFHAEGTLVVKPLTLGVLLHPPLAGGADLRAGLHAAYFQYDVRVPLAPRRKDEPGFAVSLGLDVPLGHPRWLLSGEARYLHGLREEEERDVYGDLTAFVAQLGVAYRVPIR